MIVLQTDLCLSGGEEPGPPLLGQERQDGAEGAVEPQTQQAIGFV